jgi:hypothetical protein
MTAQANLFPAALLAELKALRAAWDESPGDPDDFFNLMALCGGLQRLKPDQELNTAQTELKAVLHVSSHLAIPCLLMFRPALWLEDAAGLVQAQNDQAKEDPFKDDYDEKEESLAHAARELLGQLDDAQLALSVVKSERLGKVPELWEKAVLACVEYVQTQPEMFQEAGDWAAQMTGTFKSSGELACEYDLDQSAGLLELVASAADFWREDQGFKPALDLPITDLVSLVRAADKVQNIEEPELAGTATKSLPVKLELLSPVALAAQGENKVLPFEPLRWVSVDQSWTASLVLPLKASADEIIPLKLSPSEGFGLRPTRFQLGQKSYDIKENLAEIPFEDLYHIQNLLTSIELVLWCGDQSLKGMPQI